MLEKKHLVFLAGATAPFAPPLCTALQSSELEVEKSSEEKLKWKGETQIHGWQQSKDS